MDLNLDEHGVQLESVALIPIALGLSQREARELICDGPFLVVLMRKKAPRPYFAAWIASVDVLRIAQGAPPAPPTEPDTFGSGYTLG